MGLEVLESGSSCGELQVLSTYCRVCISFGQMLD